MIAIETENLLYKLEEKMVALLTDTEGLRNDNETLRQEREELRQQVQRLHQEVATLKQDKETHSRKLQDLISLLDSVNPTTEQNTTFGSVYAAKPVLVQA